LSYRGKIFDRNFAPGDLPKRDRHGCLFWHSYNEGQVYLGSDLKCLRGKIDSLELVPMKFAAAILVFALFAFFISWGVIELLKGMPWLLIAAMGVFLGTFIKYGCRSH